MTDALDTAVAAVVGALDAIGDPIERHQASRQAEIAIKRAIKGVRQRIALELKLEHGRTWREIGQIMGDVSAQRAEQISRGV